MLINKLPKTQSQIIHTSTAINPNSILSINHNSKMGVVAVGQVYQRLGVNWVSIVCTVVTLINVRDGKDGLRNFQSGYMSFGYHA